MGVGAASATSQRQSPGGGRVTTKTCSVCGAQYGAASFAALQFCGVKYTTEDDAEYRLEMRNCTCGSTLAIERKYVIGHAEIVQTLARVLHRYCPDICVDCEQTPPRDEPREGDR